jgi:ubiquinone/menaquinone biosynthesis C-methylase UbiE
MGAIDTFKCGFAQQITATLVESRMESLELDVKTREREFHDQRFGAESDPRSDLSKYYSVTQESRELYRSLIRAHAPAGSKVLEYGCGDGANFNFYKSLNCDFYAIDISSEAIKKAAVAAASRGFECKYSVADAEHTDFDTDFFDLVLGSGILHHLDIDKSLAELSRMTKQTGSCVFFEPLGHNPLINTFRALTPKVRSQDEHPLRNRDLETMKRYFGSVEISYFHFFSLAAAPFRGTRFFDKAIRRLGRLDAFFVRKFGWFGKYCWICVIRMSNPLKA